MKKIFSLFVIAILGLALASCEGSTLTAPTNVKIENCILTFDEVVGVDGYRVELKNIKTNEIIRRKIASNNVDLNTLNISEGEYMLKVQSMKGKEASEYSVELAYKQKDLYAVKEIKETALIDGNYIKWMGRTSYDEVNKKNVIYYSASGFEVKAKKTDELFQVVATIHATNYANNSMRPYIVLVLDNDFENTITIELKNKVTEVEIVGESGFVINDEEEHTIALYKRSESIDSHIALEKLTTTGKFISGVSYKERKIEVVAASSSTGYGNLGNSSNTKNTSNSDALNAFAFLTAQNLNAEINIVSASGWGISASRWTTPNTLNMKDKYKYVDVFSSELWDYSKYTPDVIVTNFGTNDYSYINVSGLTQKEKQNRIDNFINCYVEFLNNLHEIYPNAQIVILYGLMLESGVYGYTEDIYNEAVKTIPNLSIIKIEGDAKGCNSHPSRTSHKTISDKLTQKIKELMNW